MQKLNRKQARTLRVRSSVKNSGRPRLTIFRSNMHIWAQVIDDTTHKTIVSVNTKSLKVQKGDTKTSKSTALGAEIAKLALAKILQK